jgi:predicted ester cyclase
VVTHWTARGTHRGELMGIPPTERAVTVSGITLDRLADGRIAESIGSWDASGMLQQLGVLSGQEPSRA